LRVRTAFPAFTAVIKAGDTTTGRASRARATGGIVVSTMLLAFALAFCARGAAGDRCERGGGVRAAEPS
jgi:hypothetical protein